MAGCEGESVAIYCSHVRAVVGFIYTKYNTEAAKVFGCSFVLFQSYMAESINSENGFLAFKCGSMEDFEVNKTHS